MLTMDWDDLRFFLAVTRGGSLAAAARALNVKHSTVLRRIGNLEQGLGVRLFEKTPSGYLMNGTSGEVLDLAQEVEALIFEIERRVTGRDRELKGELRVSMTDVVGRQMAPALTAFRRKHPGILVDALISPEPLNLAKRQADVAIRVTNQPEPYLVGRRLVDVRFAVYGTRGYLDGRSDEQSGRTGWAAYDWVVLDQAGAEFPQGAWEAKNLTPDMIALRTNSSPLVFDAVHSGIGVAMLAKVSAESNPAFVRVGTDDFDFGLSTWVLTHPDLKRVPRIRMFMDFLIGEVAHPTVGFPYR